MMMMMIFFLPLLLISGGGVIDGIKKNDDEINDRRPSPSFMLLVSASSHLPLPTSSTSTVLHKDLQLEEDAHRRPLQSISSLRLRRMSNKRKTTKTSYDNDQQHDNVDGGGVATATTADAATATAAVTSMKNEDDENKDEKDKDHEDDDDGHDDDGHNVLKNDHSKTVTMMNNQVLPLAHGGVTDDEWTKEEEENKETAFLPPQDYEKTQFLPPPNHNRHEEQLLLRSDHRKIQQALIEQPPYWIQLGDDIYGEYQYDESGTSISISDDGTVLAVSSERNSGKCSDSGHVRVYHYNGTAWNQIGADIDGEANDDFSGESISLSGDGTTVAIGASFNDGNSPGNIGDNRGHVRVFKYIRNDSEGGNWTQLGDDIDGQGSGDKSGQSVSLSRDGTVLAVGAPNNDGNSNDQNDNRGHIRVYQYVNNTWGRIGVDIEGESAGDNFGKTMSLSGDGTVLAVGIQNNNEAPYNSNRGHVQVYKYANSTWSKLVKDDINGENAGEKSVSSVSLSGDGTVVAFVADYIEGSLINGRVRVYKFNNNDGNWTQLGVDIDGGEGNISDRGEIEDGVSVSLSGDGTVVAVGARFKSLDGQEFVGRVQLYKYQTNGNWTQLGVDIDGEAAYDYFGSSVSLSRDGTTVAVSAPDNDGAVLFSNVGHVRVYRANITTESPSYTPTHVPTTSTPSDSPTHMPTTAAPSKAPTNLPSYSPTNMPTTASPSTTPTNIPSNMSPSSAPTHTPTTATPSKVPTTISPSKVPTNKPATTNPSHVPSTVKPTSKPSQARILPTNKPISTKKPITIKPTKKKSEKKVRVAGNNIFH